MKRLFCFSIQFGQPHYSLKVVKNLTISQADCSGMMAVTAVIGYNCGTAEHLQASGKVTSTAYNVWAVSLVAKWEERHPDALQKILL